MNTPLVHIAIVIVPVSCSGDECGPTARVLPAHYMDQCMKLLRPRQARLALYLSVRLI